MDNDTSKASKKIPYPIVNNVNVDDAEDSEEAVWCKCQQVFTTNWRVELDDKGEEKEVAVEIKVVYSQSTPVGLFLQEREGGRKLNWRCCSFEQE